MLRFLVFADLHYKKKMYASTVGHLKAILKRAHDEKVDFCVHLGDFSNDYIGSPEIVKAYLSNEYDLPVFGVYGNHELESSGNSMEVVTPLLCNRAVTFGGKGVGFWHFDLKDYRLLGLDTNYSYSPELGVWQHNTTASWGAPKGNIKHESLSPIQLKWLDDKLCEAQNIGKKVLVFSHAALSGVWRSSPDANAVRSLFNKYRNTVLLALNGHLHTDHFCVLENVAYFDVNTVLNGFWDVMNEHHYSDVHTFKTEIFDGNMERVAVEDTRLISLTQGKNTWFFEDPLSAVVEVGDSGEISVWGSKTKWKYGVLPPKTQDGVKPMIEDRSVKLK